MLQVPTSDLSGFLEHEPQWYVELFNERSFEALLHSVGRFDCIVVGYNAAHRGRLIRECLQSGLPEVGLCVLHQRHRPALSFLQGDVGVDLVDLEVRHPVAFAQKMDPALEILLNCPRHVALDDFSGEALCALDPGAGSRWRPVLEVVHGGTRRPVLLRSHTGRRPAVAVCSVLLDPGDSAHAALLNNMIMWCAAGRPEATIVGAPDDDSTRRLHRKLFVQGMSAVVVPPPKAGKALDFGKWPLVGVRDALVQPEDDPTTAPDWRTKDPGGVVGWLARGGRIVRVGPEAYLTLTQGERYLRWVATRWAAWFMANPSASWHGPRPDGEPGSIISTRAVLNVIRQLALSEAEGVDLAELGLHPVLEYAEPVKELLAARLRGLDHCDGTVGVTAAALELGRWLGVLPLRRRERIAEWLREEFRARERAGVGFEERLEIARVLPDRELLLQALAGDVPPVLSAVMINKLREATVACELEPADVSPELVRTESSVGRTRDHAILRSRSIVARELDTSPLLAASYLVALMRLRSHWPADTQHVMAHPEASTLDRAVASVARNGLFLSPRITTSEGAHEQVCTETLALLTYFAKDPFATQVLQDARGALPPPLVASVLEESQSLRDENARIPKLEIARTRARNLLGVVAVLLTAGIATLVGQVGFAKKGLDNAEVGGLVAVVGLSLLLLFAGLNRLDLAPGWGKKLAVAISDGWSGLRSVLRTRLTTASDDEGAGDGPPASGAP
ncbi:MAG: hypothetical protein QOI98_1924 [Solirubrobacteraceae bacterium]|nr:hypothetical protein [Solirubrobacteraceae bacterium]